MVCNTCKSINFLPIEEWEQYDEDICNPSNVAFAPYQNDLSGYA
jgi:hypothetical protein